MNTHGSFEKMLLRNMRKSKRQKDAPIHWNPLTPVAELKGFSDEELQGLIDHLWHAVDSLINLKESKIGHSRNGPITDSALDVDRRFEWKKIFERALKDEHANYKSAEELSQYTSNMLEIARERSFQHADDLEQTIEAFRHWKEESKKKILDIEQQLGSDNSNTQGQPSTSQSPVHSAQRHSPAPNISHLSVTPSPTIPPLIQPVVPHSEKEAAEELSELQARVRQPKNERQETVRQLQEELRRIKSQLETLGQEVRDLWLVPVILGLPINEEEPEALRDRIQVLNELYKELEYQKIEFLNPSAKSSTLA